MKLTSTYSNSTCSAKSGTTCITITTTTTTTR